MRSNTLQAKRIQSVTKQAAKHLTKAAKEFRRILQTTSDWLRLGLSGRQWLASLLIGLMLLPIFTVPGQAAVRVNNADANISEFEPVNAPQYFWETAWTSLSNRIEEWETVRRAGNEVALNSGASNVENEKNLSIENPVKTNPDTTKSAPEKEKAGSADNENSSEESSVALPENVETKSESVTEEKNETTINPAPDAALNNFAPAAPLLVNQLPNDERESVYSYENNLGAPNGQTEMDSPNQAAATKIRHRSGIANFSFDVPLASLSGRGIDAGVGMTYNSRTWNKSLTVDPNNPNATVDHFTYDVEQSWIAPGFSSGFGYLETRAVVQFKHPHQSSNFSYYTEITPLGITDADGTRRQFGCSSSSNIPGTYSYSCNGYQSSDGTFVKMNSQYWVANPGNSQTPNTNAYNSGSSFVARYPNGSKVYYSQGFGSGTIRKHYPTVIEDSNGNRIRIVYKTDQSGRIDYIYDTLDRQIKFYYTTDTNGNPDKLVTVTIPGMTQNEELQTVRFYYEDNVPLNYTNGFLGQVTAPSTIRTLKYVYFPATKTGFKYEYHSAYGMIKKITRRVGMTVSDATSTSATGTVTSEGAWAASTEYNYPDGTTAQSDVPEYSKRTDDWQGRTSALPMETLYSSPEIIGAERSSEIIVKDKEYVNNQEVEFKIVTETVSHNTGNWMNGLIKETSVRKEIGSQTIATLSRTTYFWQQGSFAFGARQNPTLQKIEVTNEAGQTKATEFSYDQYNNQTQIKEYDFAAPNSLGTLLRTTNIGYETGAGWINANLLGLVKSVQVTVGGTVVSKTLYEYDHNGSDTTLTRRNDITASGHNPFYNPAFPRSCAQSCLDERGEFDVPEDGYILEEEREEGVAERPQDPPCVTVCTGSYTTASAYRGNVTKVGRMIDVSAASISDTNSDKTDYEYDIAGNLVSATLSCCQLKTIAYSKDTEYAFPVSETKGTSPQLTSAVEYNKYTGLVVSSTDENNQTTYYEYEADTLRQKKTIYPNTGYTLTEYSDKLAGSAAEMTIGFVRQTTTLETNKFSQSYSYFDGRGASIRSATQTPDGWSVSAMEYDALGRPKRTYNPFYASTPTGAIPQNTKYTEVTGTDALGRTTDVKLQDNTTVNTAFNGTVVTVTDQAGKQRRQTADALGRIVRVDEPNAAGNLDVGGNPAQPTYYEYDGNDNLTKVTQSDGTTTQERRFKYDSLSRLTHEKQVEATATLDDNGVKGTPANDKWTKVLKYNSHGLLTEGVDARGVKTTFTYDGLNRVSAVAFANETGYQTPTVTYTYDQQRSGYFNTGALTTVQTAASGDAPVTATEFDYDKMGRVVKHRQSIGTQVYPLEYGYNLAGQLTSEKYPSGKIVTTNYDANGRLAGVADQSRTYLSNLQYQGKGNSLSAMTFGNSTTQTFSLNDRLQMTQQNLSKGADVLQKYDYGYGQIDASGNLDTTKNNGQLAKVESYIGTTKQWTQKFDYDSLGRLSESKEYRGDSPTTLSYKQKFDYDRFGNLYRKATANLTSGQQTPLAYTPIEEADISKATNQFTSNTGTTYGEAGNVVADSKFRAMSFSYDANGRMVKAAKANTPDAMSVYDASGQRVAERVQDVWKFFIYDSGGKLIAEYGGITSTDEGGVKYVFTDWQGSTRAITSNTGFVQARQDYTAFGEEIGANVGQRTTAQGFEATNTLNQKYALTERDKATGLDHTWFRKMENKAGRWTSPDPYNGSMSLGDPQSFNRYSYVKNEPTNYIDPSGLQIIAFFYPTNCQVLRDGAITIYRCEQGVHFMDTGGGSPAAGTEGGGGGSPKADDNDAWKKCVQDVNKLYSNPPAVSREEQNSYNNDMNEAAEAHRDALAHNTEQRNNSIFWTFLGGIVGGLLGTIAEPGGGTVVGAAGGAAIGGGSALTSYEISKKDIEKAYSRTRRYIDQNHPNVVANKFFSARKTAATAACARKYLPKWWDNTKPIIQ